MSRTEDLDSLASHEYTDTVFVADGEEHRLNLVGPVLDRHIASLPPLESISFGLNSTQIVCNFSASKETLTSVSFSEYNTLSDGAFSGFEALESVNGLTMALPPFAFANCKSLAADSISIGQSEIFDGLFSGCESISSIEVESATKIGNGCFNGMLSLTSVSLPSTLETIGEDFLNGCSALSSVFIPSSVEAIGANSFAELSALSSITFEGKTMDEVSSMESYYWGVQDGVTFVCEDGNIVVSATEGDVTTQQKRKAKRRKVKKEGDEPVLPYIFANLTTNIVHPAGDGYTLEQMSIAFLNENNGISVRERAWQEGQDYGRPIYEISKSGDEYSVDVSPIESACPYEDEGMYKFAPIVESSVTDSIQMSRLWAPNKRLVSGPISHQVALKMYTPSEILLKLAEDVAEPDKIYGVCSASGEWHEKWTYGDAILSFTNVLAPSAITFTRTSPLFPSATNITYESDIYGIVLTFPRNNPSKRIFAQNLPVYRYTMDTEKSGTMERGPLTLFTAGSGRLESLAEYFEEQNELTQYMERVSTSAFNTATSAYATATSAYNMAQTVITSATNTAISAADTATQSLALITDAQEVVVSASNTATSAYDIAMSAYALSGVLQQIVDYLKEINGEEE